MAKSKKVRDVETQTIGGYPYNSLSQALKVGAAVKDHGGRNVPRELIAESLAMAQGSGLYAIVSSAKTYGIVDGTKQLSLTEAGREFFYAKSESEQRFAILKFIANPLKFKLFLDEYDGGGMPSMQMLVGLLKRSGMAETWAERTSSYFVGAIKEAGLVDEGGFLRHRAAMARAEKALKDAWRVEAAEDSTQAPDTADEFDSGPVTVTPNPASLILTGGGPSSGRATARVVDENSNVWIFEGLRVETPKPLSRALWTKLKLFVELMEPFGDE